MRYRPKSIGALHIALGGLPDKMQVQRTRTSVCPRRALENFGSWRRGRDNLAVTTPAIISIPKML